MISMSSDLLCCLVIITGLVYRSAQVPVNEFNSFGSEAGDQALARQDDAFTSFNIDFDFPFFGQLFRQVFLSTNGIITFGTGTRTYIPKPYPLVGTPSVAAYWTDSNPINGGDIFYRQEFDENTLNQITAEIRSKYVEQRNFVSQWALIVTFANVSAYGCQTIPSGCVSGCDIDVVTYQTILTSNGIQSFVIFNFNQVGYTVGVADCTAHAQVGFNAGDGKRFFLVDGSNTPNISQTALQQSNVGKAGKWMFDTASDDITSSCQSLKTLAVYPRRVLHFGRQTIEITGPCFDSHDNNVTVKIEQTKLQCTLNDSLKIVCEVPLLDKLGRNNLLVTYNGLVYESFIMAVDVSELNIPSVNFNLTTDSEFLVTWKTENVASNVVLIKGFQEDYLYDGSGMLIKLRVLPLDYGYFPNTGRATVRIQATSSSISSIGRDVAGMISKASVGVMTGARLVGAAIGIRVPVLATAASDLCGLWYDAQPSRSEMADIVDQVSRRSPCPPSMTANYSTQLINFALDKSCRPGNGVLCSVFHSGAKGCYRSTNNAGGPVAQCCYGSNDGLLLGPPSGGTLDMGDSETSLIAHWWKDLLPYFYCCYAGLCNLYYKKRPSINSTFFVPPNIVGGTGDPHFTTMDGTSYDFNPIGEFNYLLTNDDVIQTRIAQYVDSQNIARPASYFSAFVFRSGQSDIVEVDLNVVQQFRFKVNNGIVSLELTQYQFVGIAINYESNNTVTVLMASGIIAEVKILSRMLHIVLSVPTSLKGQVRGLVGNWDDDTSNDFMLPNGTWIAINSSRTGIHYLFGMAWSTTNDTSLFTYPQGLTWFNYQNFRFVPTFVDSQPHPACGNDTACAYDIMTTNDVNVGVSNIVILDRIREIREMYKNMLNGLSEITMSAGASTLSTDTSPVPSFTSIDTSTGPSFTSTDKSTGPSVLSSGMITKSPSTNIDTSKELFSLSTDTSTGPSSLSIETSTGPPSLSTHTSTETSPSNIDTSTGRPSSSTGMSTRPPSSSTDTLAKMSSSVTHMSTGPALLSTDTSTGPPSSSTDTSARPSSSSTDTSTGPPSSSSDMSTGPSSSSPDTSSGTSFSNIDTSTGPPSSSTDTSARPSSLSTFTLTGLQSASTDTSTGLPSSSTNTSTGTSFSNIDTSRGLPSASTNMSTGPPSSSIYTPRGPSFSSTDTLSRTSSSNTQIATGTPSSSTDTSRRPSSSSTDTSTGTSFSNIDTSTGTPSSSTDTSTGPLSSSTDTSTGPLSSSTSTSTGPSSSSTDMLTRTSSSITHMSTGPSSLNTDSSAGQSFSNIDTSTGSPSSSTDTSTETSFSNMKTSTGTPSLSTDMSTRPSFSSDDMSAKPFSSSTVSSKIKLTSSALSTMASLGIHNVAVSCIVNLVICIYILIKDAY